MGSSCAITPKVRNNKGELKESKLFKDMKKVAPSRRATVEAWSVTRDSKFVQDIAPSLEKDENNEPLISEIIEKTDIPERFKFSDPVENLNKDIGYYKKNTNERIFWDKTAENKKMLYNKAKQFNKTSSFRDKYTALVSTETSSQGEQSYVIQVVPKTAVTEKQAMDMEHETTLNESLTNILQSWGLDVGVLDDVEELLGVDGISDFDSPTKLANGLIQIIKIAKGERGQKALPEEFAHVAIRLFKDNNLVQRMLDIVNTPGMIEEILGDKYQAYEEKYDGDIELLAEEAAGQLLAKHLTGEIKIPEKPYKSILSRIINFIKNFFSSKDYNSVEEAMQEANKVYGEFAANLLNNRMHNVRLENLQTKNKLYALNTKVNSLKDLVQHLVNIEVKRYKIYNSKSKDQNFWKKQKNKIETLRQSLKNNGENLAILQYISSSVDILNQLHTRLSEIKTDGKTVAELNQDGIFTLLRNVRNYVKSFEDINENIRYYNVKHPGELSDDTLLQLKELTNCMNDVVAKYTDVASYGFKEFLKKFLGEKIEVPFGKMKGTIINVEDLINTADHDITTAELWLDSMAEGSNYTLKVFDQATKRAKEKARRATIEFEKTMIAAGVEVEQAGVKGFEWMFEKDEEGNLTGYYISKTDWGKYNRARNKMYEDLKKKYGENPEGKNKDKFDAEVTAWYVKNSVNRGDGVKVPNSKYDNPEFARQMSNSAKKKFYETTLRAKAKFDSYLPPSATKLLRTIKIEKDTFERIKSKGLSQTGKQLWESCKDDFLERSGDNEFGTVTGIKDFEGRAAEQLPVYYTHLKGGVSENDMSTDVVSTMIAYAAMANDYKQMHEIIDVLETGRDYMQDHFEPNLIKNDKTVEEHLEAFGETVVSTITKTAKGNNTMSRLNKYFSMQVYGHYMDESSGNIPHTKVSKQKAANQINKFTALNQLAVSVLAGVSNVTTGIVMMNIEAAAGEFFKPKSIRQADALYAAQLPETLAQVGARVQTSKLYLFDELFNVFQDEDQHIHEIDFDKKSKFLRLAKTSSLYLFNHCGEHWMQNRTALALAMEYKMKDSTGKECNLWDALEVKYINPSNKKLGARLVLKKGYTKADGSAFTDEDIYKFSRKNAAINFRMHGIYNKLDRSAIQALALGRMAVMYRKWIVPALNRRFRRTSKNLDLDMWEEGYYRTFGRFLWHALKEVREGQFQLLTDYHNLTKEEKSNFKRAVTEIGHFIAVCVALAALGMGGDDDDDSSYAAKLLELILRRQKAELGSMIPSPYLANEGYRILSSPAAGISTTQGVLDLAGLLNPFNYEEFGGEDAIVESGQWEGYTKATKLVMDSPFVPMQKTLYRTLHPEDSLPFYRIDLF